MDPEKSQRPGPRILALVAALATLAMAPALLAELAVDAPRAIAESECVTGDFDSGRILGRNFWCQPPGTETIDSWRPWPVATWWVLWRVGQGAPWPFFLLGIFLHALCAVQLARLAARFTAEPESGPLAAAIAGCWFAVMPVHVEAVASAVGIADIWALFFGLIAIDALLLTARSNRPLGPAALCLGTFCLALASKESAVVFAPLLAIIAILGPVRGPAEARPRRRAVILAMVALVLVAAYIALRAQVIGSFTAERISLTVNPLSEHSFAARLPMALELLWRYMALALSGQPLSADYSYNAIPVVGFGWRAALGAAIALGLAGILLWRRRQAGTRVLILWLAGAFALISNILVLLPAMFAERLFYGPSAPLCLLVGALFAPLLTPRLRRPVRALGAVYLALCVIASAVHAYAWTSAERITEVTVTHSPTSARAHIWRARILGRQGDADGVARHALEAMAILPEHGAPHALLGSAWDMQNRPDKALPAFQRSFELAPQDPEVADLFIQFLLRYGHVQQAGIIYRKHLRARGGAPSPRVTRPPGPDPG